MELELKKGVLDTYYSVPAIMLTQEETAETIVPDYCPDIARIVRTEGQVFLHDRELRDGKAELNGTVRVNILYTPEGERGLRKMDLAIPFSMESERGSFLDCSHITAQVKTLFIETRMLNPRKVFTRCKLLGHIGGYRREQLSFAEDVNAQEHLCVEKRLEKQNAVLLRNISERDFTFTDEILLAAGKEVPQEILGSRIRTTVTESKYTGSKVIFKGMFHISVLCRTADGNCTMIHTDLPFSQVMDTPEYAENAQCELCLQLTGYDLQLSGDDSDRGSMTVTIYFHAEAFLYVEEEIALLEDLYSTAHETTYDGTTLELTAFRETMTRRQTVREMLEIGVVADTVLSLTADCGSVNVSREGGSTVLRTNVMIRALYQDEGGAVLMAERNAEICCHLEIPENRQVHAQASSAETILGTIGERGIEVRFPVDFEICTEVFCRRVSICAAQIDHAATKDLSAAPSLVLRCLQKQETPWEIAKKYNTTVKDILSANQLEDQYELPRDRLLLIPKKRV